MPAATEVGGEPEIVSAALTWIENAGSDAEAVPSLTVITMPEYVPTLAALGVPERVPLVLLKVSQAGRLATLKVSLSPSGSLAVGVNV